MHFLLTRPSGSAVCRGTTPSFLGAVTHSLRYHGIVDAGRNRPFIAECSKRVNMEEEEDGEDRVARQRRWGHKSLRSKSDKKKSNDVGEDWGGQEGERLFIRLLSADPLHPRPSQCLTIWTIWLPHNTFLTSLILECSEVLRCHFFFFNVGGSGVIISITLITCRRGQRSLEFVYLLHPRWVSLSHSFLPWVRRSSWPEFLFSVNVFSCWRECSWKRWARVCRRVGVRRPLPGVRPSRPAAQRRRMIFFFFFTTMRSFNYCVDDSHTSEFLDTTALLYLTDFLVVRSTQDCWLLFAIIKFCELNWGFLQL